MAIHEFTSEGDRLLPPQSWHESVRRLPGLSRDDADVYVTQEVFLPPTRIAAALLSVTDTRGFAGLPQGLYLLTNAEPEELFGSQPEATSLRGELFMYITQAIAGDPTPGKPAITAPVPHQILTAAQLPVGTEIDFNGAFNLVYLEGHLEGFPVYGIFPLTTTEAQDQLAHTPHMFVHRRPRS